MVTVGTKRPDLGTALSFELKLVAKRERKADGKLGAKFKLYVFDAGAATSASQATTHESVQTLKLRFSALRGRVEPTTQEPLKSISIPSGEAHGPVIETPINPQGKKFGFD